MKKVFLFMGCLMLMAQLSFAGRNVYTTDSTQLPEAARTFIAKYFPGTGVAHIKIEKEFLDGKQYDVILTNGIDLDFDSKGEWKEIDGHRQVLPAAVVPEKIRQYIEKNYREVGVTSLDRDRKGFDVKLTNGLELKFSPAQVFLRIDD